MDEFVLQPFNPAEAIGSAEAARRAGRSIRTLREWVAVNPIGRMVGGRWQFSQCALDMFLAGDFDALDRYASGDRDSPDIVAYFKRRGVPIVRAADVA